MYRLRTVAFGTVVSVSALIALAAPASAHVSVFAPGATRGGEAVVTFRVPNEEASATTTKVVVLLPVATPIASVSVHPTPGWTAVTASTKLATPIKTDDGVVSEAVSQVTWTAGAAAAIKPGEFQEFDLELGPLPDAPSVAFKALQTYSDGTVVRWIETAAPGTAEPQHPAPVLQLAATSTSSVAPPASAGTAAASTSGSSNNTGPIVLSIIALALAAGALGLGVVNRARGRATP